jgi:hypothetical protein
MEPTIQIYTDVREKYKSGWENKIREKDISEIVIHATAGGTTANGVLLWMLNGEKYHDYIQGIGLFHYIIDRDISNIIEVLDPNYWCWHSSSSSHDHNTIGIELVNPSKTNRLSFTEIQYQSLFDLIFDKLLIDYPTIKSIVSHDFNAWKYSKRPPKPCPGAFDWKKLEAELMIRNILYTNDSPQSYQLT